MCTYTAGSIQILCCLLWYQAAGNKHIPLASLVYIRNPDYTANPHSFFHYPSNHVHPAPSFPPLPPMKRWQPSLPQLYPASICSRFSTPGEHNSARSTTSLKSYMWEMYIFVSANTKQHRMLGQHQTDGSEKGRRSERSSLPPSLFPSLCFSERSHYHSSVRHRGASVYKGGLNSPDSTISSL